MEEKFCCLMGHEDCFLVASPTLTLFTRAQTRLVSLITRLCGVLCSPPGLFCFFAFDVHHSVLSVFLQVSNQDCSLSCLAIRSRRDSSSISLCNKPKKTFRLISSFSRSFSFIDNHHRITVQAGQDYAARQEEREQKRLDLASASIASPSSSAASAGAATTGSAKKNQ